MYHSNFFDVFASLSAYFAQLKLVAYRDVLEFIDEVPSMLLSSSGII